MRTEYPTKYFHEEAGKIWIQLTDAEFLALKPGDPVVIYFPPTYLRKKILELIFSKHEGLESSTTIYGSWKPERFGKWYIPDREEIHELIGYDS